MKQENPGGENNIVMLLVIGAIGYFGYQYLVSSGMWAQWFGGTGAATSGIPTGAQLAPAIQAGQYQQVGTDASGNIVVKNVSTGGFLAVNPSSGAISVSAGPTTSTLALPPATTVASNPVAPPAPPTTPPTAAQLQAYANIDTYAVNGNLIMDRWLYYWQLLTGITLSGAQVAPLMAALGLTTDTRDTTFITASQMVAALSSSGLSGIVMVPNSGPIKAPLPTVSQNFGKGYGGYSGGGYTKGNGYVQ